MSNVWYNLYSKFTHFFCKRSKIGFIFSERDLYQKSFASNKAGLIYTFEKVLEKAVAESPDLKKLEKQFKKQLSEFEVEKELLEMQLKNKNIELNQLQLQLIDKEV